MIWKKEKFLLLCFRSLFFFKFFLSVLIIKTNSSRDVQNIFLIIFFLETKVRFQVVNHLPVKAFVVKHGDLEAWILEQSRIVQPEGPPSS